MQEYIVLVGERFEVIQLHKACQKYRELLIVDPTVIKEQFLYLRLFRLLDGIGESYQVPGVESIVYQHQALPDDLVNER